MTNDVSFPAQFLVIFGGQAPASFEAARGGFSEWRNCIFRANGLRGLLTLWTQNDQADSACKLELSALAHSTDARLLPHDSAVGNHEVLAAEGRDASDQIYSFQWSSSNCITPSSPASSFSSPPSFHGLVHLSENLLNFHPPRTQTAGDCGTLTLLLCLSSSRAEEVTKIIAACRQMSNGSPTAVRSSAELPSPPSLAYNVQASFETAQTQQQQQQQQQPKQQVYSARVTNKHVSIIDPESVLQFQRQHLQLQGNEQTRQLLQENLETQQQQQDDKTYRQQEQPQKRELCEQNAQEQQQQATTFARHNSYADSPVPAGSSSMPVPEFDKWLESKGGGARQLQSMGEYCLCLREVLCPMRRK
jgi:hypothetical protein